jgi:hypothetical protein
MWESENIDEEKRNGKTLRLKNFHAPIKNSRMQINRNYEHNKNNNTVTHGITNIDQQFNIDAEKSNEIILNKEYLWDNLVTELEQYPCYQKIITDDMYTYDAFIFRVPIKEQKIVKCNDKMYNNMGWFLYNNKYYDPNKIYTIEYDSEENIKSIEEGCDKQINNKTFSNLNIQPIGVCDLFYDSEYEIKSRKYCNYGNNFIMDNRNHKSYICAYYRNTHKININSDYEKLNKCDNKQYIDWSKRKTSIILDMKKINVITHIGIINKKIETQKINLNNKTEIEYISNKLEVTHNKKKELIGDGYIYTPIIEGIGLWYKDIKTKKWVSIDYSLINENGICLINLKKNFNTKDGIQCEFLKVSLLCQECKIIVFSRGASKSEYIDKSTEYTVLIPSNNKKIQDGQYKNKAKVNKKEKHKNKNKNNDCEYNKIVQKYHVIDNNISGTVANSGISTIVSHNQTQKKNQQLHDQKEKQTEEQKREQEYNNKIRKLNRFGICTKIAEEIIGESDK